MRRPARPFIGLACIVMLAPVLAGQEQTTAPAGGTQQAPADRPQAAAPLAAAPNPQSELEDGTAVRLRISQTVSSADAHLNDTVQFEVLEEVRVGDTVVIPKGGIAWGTVTEAQPKRRMARGGKLEIVMDSVRLADGEKASLRATKEVKGGGHTGAMTAGIVATGLLFWPAAPFFLFMHGKDITIPKGTEVPTFVAGNFPLDLARFRPAAPVQVPAEAPASVGAQLTITSIPAGADIEVDGMFAGNTPSTIVVAAGEHTITVRKAGFATWEKKIAVTGGTIQISADLEASEVPPAPGAPQEAPAPQTPPTPQPK
jgi:hypothetical protein